MTAFTISIDAETQKRLRVAAAEMGRTVDDLIQSAAEESARDYFRHRKDDPARRAT